MNVKMVYKKSLFINFQVLENHLKDFSGKVVDFLHPIYSLESSESEFSSIILRFSYSSLKTPPSVYDYDMNASSSVLKKIETVLGGFDASKYMTKRKWATASDGTQIPLSIVYRKDLMKLDGSDPLLLYGYGSYEPFAMTGWRLGYGLLWSSVLFYTCTQIWELSKSVFQEKEDGCEHKTHEKSQTSSIFIYIYICCF